MPHLVIHRHPARVDRPRHLPAADEGLATGCAMP
jgi:hypothetical protein